MLKLYCPHCHGKVGVREHHLGKAGQCPHCGKPIRVPKAKFGAPAHAGAAKAAPPPSRHSGAQMDAAEDGISDDLLDQLAAIEEAPLPAGIAAGAGREASAGRTTGDLNAAPRQEQRRRFSLWSRR